MKDEYRRFLAGKQEPPKKPEVREESTKKSGHPTLAECPVCCRPRFTKANGDIRKHRSRRIGQRWCAGSGLKGVLKKV